MIKITAVLLEQSLASSATLPLEIWMAAGQAAKAHRPPITTPVITRFAGLKTGPMQLAGGLEVHLTMRLEDALDTDIWILPALWRNPLKALYQADVLAPTLKLALEKQQTICSVGTASFLLAQTGLLNERAATTHWAYFDLFKSRYPQIKLQKRHLITQSENVYCVGSVNSIADVMVHLIELKLGSAIAHAVETQFSPEIRKKFEAAAYQDQGSNTHHDELILEAQSWLDRNSHTSVALYELADHLNISSRSLNRRFKEATGQTPSAYHLKRRVQASKELLKNSNLRISDLAWRMGFQDAAGFSRWFRANTDSTPSRYRRAARGKLFSHKSE